MFNAKTKMKPILIKTDKQKIDQAKSLLSQAVIDCQAVYDLFKSVGVELTLTEIAEWLFKQWLHQPKNHISDFVADKIIETTGLPNFGGVPIKKEKLKELIALPELKQLEKPLKDLAYKYEQIGVTDTSFRTAQLQLIDGVISATSEAATDIESRFTYYTQNSRGHEVAAKLLATVTYLNELSDFVAISDQSDKGRNLTLYQLPGLLFNYDMYNGTPLGELILDLDFIRNQERLFSKVN